MSATPAKRLQTKRIWTAGLLVAAACAPEQGVDPVSTELPLLTPEPTLDSPPGWVPGMRVCAP